ncbi:serine/threonine-protein phosphatase 6 regulatory ankyrin repeat subunit B-like isoform X2 [Dendronephthya gigantea]|uniref:serine/threonine-protein phosphatase 6 regulatory ankyrin repeat subunit B-like isoform X2 n=1 Tax=Dendronephthya gigantea TaxID=151771 RepID=UPI00106C4617|nr:serine/threonine-protein phosphatase 6 regulatory ankyrin repeat subunit B-like isoform X2 [Dendronephthya gigantea]
MLAGEWMTALGRMSNLQENSSELSQANANGSTPIMVACKEGKNALVEKLLERGASLSDIDMDGMTALHYAAVSGSESTVKVLVKQKSELTLATNNQGRTALHLACTRIAGAVPVVKFLVKSMGEEAKTTRDKDGNTPLLLAVETGNQLVVRELLANKSKEQLRVVKADSGDSAFHYCARKKDVEMARILIDAGSAINLKNNDGQTAFHIAAYEGDEGMIKLLSTSNKLSADIQDNYDRTAVHIAAERGFSDIVEYLVDKVKVDVNFRAKTGDTLVHIAAQNGHSDTVLTLLKKGVPLHMPNKSGEVSLHAAVHCGHVGVVKALLNKGASVDTKTKDMYTPLHIAVQHRQPRVVQALLGYGANVHLKGGRLEETPLHIAARIKGGTEVADMLLKSGANVDVPQENGETSLHIATRNNNLAMVKLLLTEGANAARKSRTGEIPLHIAIEKSLEEIVLVLVDHTLTSCLNTTHGVKMIVNLPNKKGETPLHYVCKLKNDNEIGERDLRTAKLLLKYGANPNLETVEGKETPVHYCARHGKNDVLLAMFNALSVEDVQRLVNQKTNDSLTPLLISSKEGNLDVNKSLMSRHARLDAFDQKGKTSLHLSCEHGHKDVVHFLLNSKAYINAKTKLGLTALHLAAQKGYKDIVDMLVTSFGASIDALSLEGKTPLHLAAEGGRLEVCKILLHLKADTSATDSKGRTPLHYAAQKDHSEVIEFFLENRPQLVNQANAEGETCAHIAAAKGSVAVIKELLKLKNIHMTEKFTLGSNSTPLHLAASGGHADVVQVLLDNGADVTQMDKHGLTAIHLAAKNGHIRVIEILRGKIPLDYASPKTGLSAIHVAAQYGRTEVVREILRQADVGDIRSEAIKTKKDDEYGYTPLHLAARSGNDQVVRLLLNSPGVRVDSSTSRNRSLPLHLASSNGHVNVVGLLLSKISHQLDTKDAKGRTSFHLAAANGHHNVLTLLLAQGAQIDAEDEDGWTALHFSAHSGHLPVVKQLIESGTNLTKETNDGKVALCYAAHAGHVIVVRYLLNLKFDASHLLKDKTFLFDLMVCGKGNGNDSIVSFILHSPAPLYAAVKLSHHYRTESSKFKERSKDLIAAGDACEELALDILTLACTNDASQLLNATDDSGKPFLDVLVECEQKHCVAHTAVQSYLGSKWRAGRNWSMSKVLAIFFGAFIAPPVWVALSLPWNNNYSRVPLVKFICQLISHLYFMLLFVFTVVIPWDKRSDDVTPAWYEVLLLFWLCGLVLTQLTDPKNSRGLGRVPLFVIFLSAIAILIHFSAIPFDGITRVHLLYARNQLFAVAMFLTFVQLLDFLTFHHLFGPWGVIIGNLMQDLARFIVILLIFMLGFTVHIAAVTNPGFSLSHNHTSVMDNLREARKDLVKIFKLLFFSLFGSADTAVLDELTGNDMPSFARVLVNIVFGLYSLITIVVLINLLIAMMSDTYQRIQAQSDLEWKFGRAKLIRKLERSTRTPAPLNLLTTTVTYLKLARKVKCRCCRPDIMEILHEETSDEFVMTKFPSTNSVGPGLASGVITSQNHSNKRIEHVVDWGRIVRKFKALRGMDGKEEVQMQEVIHMDNEKLTAKSVHDIKNLVEGLLKKINTAP